MHSTKTASRALLAFLMLLAAAPGLGQLPAPNEAGVSTGHIHLTVPDRDQHLDIWRGLGGEVDSSGMVKFPGIYILLTEGEAEAPSIDTTANHIGFTVRDYDSYKSRLEEAGASFFYQDDDNGQILADLPDGLRVEILKDEGQKEPVVFHHMHLAAQDLQALQDWYIKVFGAEAGERRGLPSALVPGGRVDIMGVMGEAPRGSRGGTIDHIGFEVVDMDAFAERLADLGLAFDIPPRRIEAMDLTIAFLTDPEGTFIEVSQGLAERD